MSEEKNELVEVIYMVQDEMPEWMKEMGGDNSGNEDVGRDDIVIPRLSLIQAISPELDEKDPKFIPGAKSGLLFNTLTRELMESILVISVKFEKPYLLWRDRKKGGGFGGQFDTEKEAVEAIQSKEDPDEWEVADTPSNLCIAIPADRSPYEIAVPMPKSKAKISRNWNSLARLAGGPRFSRVYKITSVDDKNSAGEKFKNFKVEMAGFPSKELFDKAKEVYEMLNNGIKYKADYSDETAGEEAASESAPF